MTKLHSNSQAADSCHGQGMYKDTEHKVRKVSQGKLVNKYKSQNESKVDPPMLPLFIKEDQTLRRNDQNSLGCSNTTFEDDIYSVLPTSKLKEHQLIPQSSFNCGHQSQEKRNKNHKVGL